MVRTSLYVVLLSLAALAVVASVVLAARDWPTTGDWSNAGLRGDYWGGHLAAGGSLAGALLFFVAILMQRDELALQRTELAEARRVYEAQERQLAAQADQLERQSRIAQRKAVVDEFMSVLKTKLDVETPAVGKHNTSSMSGAVYQARWHMMMLLEHESLSDDEAASLGAMAGIDFSHLKRGGGDGAPLEGRQATRRS